MTTHGDAMSDRDWLYQELQKLQTQMLSQHVETRREIQTLAGDILAKLDAHAADDLLVANRVLVIETQRTEEAKQALKRSTAAGLVAGSAVPVFWEAVKHWFNK